MRETWLSMRRIRLADLYPRLDVGADYEYELHFAHLFVIGNDQTKPDVLQSIRNESLLFNDILMIDVQENYKNLIYKHLALVNWVSSFWTLTKLDFYDPIFYKFNTNFLTSWSNFTYIVELFSVIYIIITYLYSI